MQVYKFATQFMTPIAPPTIAPYENAVAIATGTAARIFKPNRSPTPKTPKMVARFATSGSSFVGVFGASTAIGRIIA